MSKAIGTSVEVDAKKILEVMKNKKITPTEMAEEMGVAPSYFHGLGGVQS